MFGVVLDIVVFVILLWFVKIYGCVVYLLFSVMVGEFWCVGWLVLYLLVY